MRQQFLLAALLLFIALSGCPQGGGELTLGQAKKLVFEQVIQPSENKDQLLLYTWPDRLGEGDIVSSYYGSEAVFIVGGPSWFFWIDDEPEARFEHSTRFVLVNALTGEIKVEGSGFWPFINEYSMIAPGSGAAAAGFTASPEPSAGIVSLSGLSSKSAAETFSVSDLAGESGGIFFRTTVAPEGGGGTASGNDCPCENPKKYAVVVAGKYEPKNGFTVDSENMASFLGGQGYEVTHLRPQLGGGQGSAANSYQASFVGAATPAMLKQKLAEIASKIRCCDEFVFYLSTHGSTRNCDKLKSLYSGPNPEGLPLSKIKEAVLDKSGFPVPKGRANELCFELDPPIKEKYKVKGESTRDWGETTFDKISPPEITEKVSGNPDGGFIGTSDLDEALDGMGHCCNVTLIFDTCQSGAANTQLSQAGRAVISSTEADNVAGGTEKGGLFTNWMLEQLKSGDSISSSVNEGLKELEKQRAERSKAHSEWLEESLILGGDAPNPPTPKWYDYQKGRLTSTPCEKECCPSTDDVVPDDDSTTSRPDDNVPGTEIDDDVATDDDIVITPPPDPTLKCTPKWQCNEWSSWGACTEGERTRTRSCTDANNCGTSSGKPSEKQTQDFDSDNDGHCDDVDNCASSSNPNQEDSDNDGKGNACDKCPDDSANDADNDGKCEGVDNCPNTYNPSQEDHDSDGIGSLCDPVPINCAQIGSSFGGNSTLVSEGPNAHNTCSADVAGAFQNTCGEPPPNSCCIYCSYSYYYTLTASNGQVLYACCWGASYSETIGGSCPESLEPFCAPHNPFPSS